MLPTILASALLLAQLSPGTRPGDRDMIQAPLPILPGGEPAEVLLHCDSFRIFRWRHPDGLWTYPRPNAYLWENRYTWRAKQAARDECRRQWP